MQLPPSQSLDNLLAGLSTDRWSADDLSSQHDMDLDRLPHPPPVLVKAEVGGLWARMGLLVHFEGNGRVAGLAGVLARLIGGLGLGGAPFTVIQRESGYVRRQDCSDSSPPFLMHRPLTMGSPTSSTTSPPAGSRRRTCCSRH